MIRRLLSSGLLAAALIGLLVPSANAATVPERSDFFDFGVLPVCNGQIVVFDIVGQALFIAHPNGGSLLLRVGRGDAENTATGQIYAARLDDVEMIASHSGSFTTGHFTLHLSAGPDTVVVHAIGHVNLRPGEPVFVQMSFDTCAGLGRQPPS